MLNQLTLVGALTKAPDVRYTPEGNAILQTELKVNGDILPIVFHEKQAEKVGLKCNEGSILGITGRLAMKTFWNKEELSIEVENIQFLGIEGIGRNE